MTHTLLEHGVLSPPTPPPAVRLERASKRYGVGPTTVYAMREVTLDVWSGTFTAVMGPSGSGKSTLLQCAAGLDTLSEGRVFLGATELSTLGEQERTLLRRERVGFVFQAFNLVPWLTVAENIRLPLTLAGRKPEAVWYHQLVDRVGLHERQQHRPAELSGGQQQRAALARALITRPDVVFADEPTGNLDSQARAQVLGLLRQAVEELRQTVIMVTHDPAAATVADRVLFFADGKVVDALDQPSVDQILSRLRQPMGVQR